LGALVAISAWGLNLFWPATGEFDGGDGLDNIIVPGVVSGAPQR
jgi:hypothetical protein